MHEYDEYYRTWALRILVTLGEIHRLEYNDNLLDFNRRELANIIHFNPDEFEDCADEQFLEMLRTELNAVNEKEREAGGLVPQSMVIFGAHLGLSATDTKLLFFTSISLENKIFSALWSNIRVYSITEFYYSLSIVLNTELHEVKSSLQPKSRLHKLRLVEIVGGFTLRLESQFDVDSLESSVNSPAPLNYFEPFFTRVTNTNIKLAEFSHLAQHSNVLSSYIKNAVAQKKIGVNVLVHGVPGIGKSLYINALMQSLNIPAYEIAHKDADGDSYSPRRRLTGCAISQTILQKNQPAVLIFDEADSCINEDIFSDDINSGHSKAWLHDLLENNEVPIVWICNDIHWIQPSVYRRFDYVLDMPLPASDVLLQIIKKSFHSIPIENEFQKWLSEQPGLTPALIKQMDKLLTCIDPKTPDATREYLKAIVASILNLPSGSYEDFKKQGRREDLSYSLDWVNTDVPIHKIVSGLKANGSAIICFKGPSGTGKTASVDFLGRELNKEVVTLRSSSVLSKYIGDTEKSIARLFAQAKQKNAIIFLDEVENLGLAREQHHQPHQFSFISELFKNMDAYPGIVVVGCNHYDWLDSALKRRIDITVTFDYLSLPQLQNAIEHLIESPAGNEFIQRRIVDMKKTTIGDLKAALKRSKVVDQRVNLDSLVRSIEQVPRY